MSVEEASELSLRKLVRMGLAIHNLNKAAEQGLGLSLVQYHVLSALLDLPGCSPLDLAGASGVHPSTLTQTLKILERKRLIIVDKHPKDSRRKILLATREGQEQRGSFEDGIRNILLGMSPTHRQWMKPMELERATEE
jgi:DNA-binding MarR family transcriptional regulator